MTDQFPNGLCSSCFEPCSGDTKCPNCGWDPGNPGFQSSQALQNGSILNGAYIIGKVLGQGGFGITYLAWDISSGRKVAIKECFPGTPRVERLANGFDLVTSGQSPEEKEEFERAVSKFIQEASTLAQFYGEPTIVEVLGLFRANKTAYMIMEYLDGHTLGEEIRKNKKLSPERVMEVALSVSKALSVIHGQGVLHRDISPDNIYITRDGSIKVLDFGTARDISGNRTMTVNLKHGYAPLEQYLGKNQGPWTDIYSLGATMFRALTGKMPPRADERKMGDDSLLLGILDQELSGRMKLVVRKALAVEIAERYQNIFDFVEVLSNGEATLPGQEEEDLFYQRTVKYSGLFPSDLQRERGSPTQDIVSEIRQEDTTIPGEPDSKKETEPALEKVLLQSPPDLQVERQERSGKEESLLREGKLPTRKRSSVTNIALAIGVILGLFIVFIGEKDRDAPSLSQGSAKGASNHAITATHGQDTPQETVERYYQLISQGLYNDAYNLFTSSRKTRLSRDGFIAGFKNTASVEMSAPVKVLYSGSNQATVGVSFISYDHSQTGEAYIVKGFQGEWGLVKEEDRWFLDKSNIKEALIPNTPVKDNIQTIVSFAEGVLGRIEGDKVLLRENHSVESRVLGSANRGDLLPVLGKWQAASSDEAILVRNFAWISNGNSFELTEGKAVRIIRKLKDNKVLVVCDYRGQDIQIAIPEDHLKTMDDHPWYKVKISKEMNAWLFGKYLRILSPLEMDQMAEMRKAEEARAKAKAKAEEERKRREAEEAKRKAEEENRKEREALDKQKEINQEIILGWERLKREIVEKKGKDTNIKPLKREDLQ